MQYPIEYTAREYEADTGTSLDVEGIPPGVQSAFMQAAHRAVYGFLYSGGGGKPFKDALIAANLPELAPVLREALRVQISYMLDAGGDYTTVSGTYREETGALILGDNAAIRAKILAPAVEWVLRGQIPDILVGCVPLSPQSKGDAP